MIKLLSYLFHKAVVSSINLLYHFVNAGIKSKITHVSGQGPNQMGYSIYKGGWGGCKNFRLSLKE